MADFIDIETAQSKSKKMSDSVGVEDVGGKCIVILVVVGEGWWSLAWWCSDVVMVGRITIFVAPLHWFHINRKKEEK